MDIGNLNGIGDKLLGAAERHGSLIGTGAVILERSNNIQEEIGLLLRGNIHAPNVNQLLTAVANHAPNRQAVFAVLLGGLAKDSKINIINKIGGLAEKVGISYLVASIAESVAWFSTHSDLPPGFIRNPGTDVGISNNKENPFKGAYA